MSDIKFKCPSCKQSLEAPREMQGRLVKCPHCSSTIEVLLQRECDEGKAGKPQSFAAIVKDVLLLREYDRKVGKPQSSAAIVKPEETLPPSISSSESRWYGVGVLTLILA